MKPIKVSRRKFLGTFAAAGSLALIPSSIFGRFSSQALNEVPDIAVVKSADYYLATVEAVNMLGGIDKFVKKGSKVGLLINGGFKNKGTFTNPDVSLAILKLCFDAGASEVMTFKASEKDYWSQAKNYATHTVYLDKTTKSAANMIVKIDKGILLKEAEMVKELFELDTLINIPVSKQNGGSMISCCLKNMMGLNTRVTNKAFHVESDQQGFTSDEYLGQCIADLNLVRKPDLCIVDATVFIINNGPHGPGELMQEDKIIAGTDPVAIDVYFANMRGHGPEDVLATKYSIKHGIGQSDLSKVVIEEKVI
jgi:uncharacterized protein (DUF362 family)